jgi:hydroxypyruvate isomerase
MQCSAIFKVQKTVGTVEVEGTKDRAFVGKLQIAKANDRSEPGTE